MRSNDGFGIKVEWDINDQLSTTFDVSTSSAENDRAGRDRFNVVGIINNYQFAAILDLAIDHTEIPYHSDLSA